MDQETSQWTESLPSANQRFGARMHPARLRLNHWALAGDWTVKRQAIVLNQPEGQIAYRFHARDLHLVMRPARRGRSVRSRCGSTTRSPSSTRCPGLRLHLRLGRGRTASENPPWLPTTFQGGRHARELRRV
jgi:hypothetical protein